LDDVKFHLEKLIESFALGNVIKNGIPVAIVGATNTGKSTLLNYFLGEERAIVSDIHGTTRDFIEDIVNINGTAFRFIDTAGIRKTEEKIEIIGIERTFEKIKKASIIILVLDAERPESFSDSISRLADTISNLSQSVIIAINKIDVLKVEGSVESMLTFIVNMAHSKMVNPIAVLPVSAKNDKGLDDLKAVIATSGNVTDIPSDSLLVTNLRHHQALMLALDALVRVEDGLGNQTPTDLLTQDIREALFHIGEIVGDINTEEILGNIFSKFCIGK
jgi:tRNA modification GTPase